MNAPGLSPGTARILAPAAFLFDFAAQQYGMFSKPNMKDVNDQNISFWSPHPFSIAGFFAPQQIVQLIWLYRLWKLDANKPKDKRELDTMLSFVPYYALGNVCIGVWMFFWNSSRLDISNIFVCINSFSQLYYVLAKLPPMDTSSTSSILTHLNAKTFAGIGVLDFLHNTSAAYFRNEPARASIKLITALGFAGLASVSDWIFGACLVYDLVALSVGQASAGDSSWSTMLGAFAVGTAAIVGVKNYFK